MRGEFGAEGELGAMASNPYLVNVEEPKPAGLGMVHLLLALILLIFGGGMLWLNSAGHRYPAGELARLESRLLAPHVKSGKVKLPDKPAKRSGKVLLVIPSIWSTDKQAQVHPQFFEVVDRLRASSISSAGCVVFVHDRPLTTEGAYVKQTASDRFDEMAGKRRASTGGKTLTVKLQTIDAYVFAIGGEYLGHQRLQESLPERVTLEDDGKAKSTQTYAFLKQWVNRNLPE